MQSNSLSYESTCVFPKTPGCYLLINEYNEKCYVGMTSNLRYRLRQHIKSLNQNNHNNYKLQTDYLENPDKFKVSILKCFTWSEYMNGTARNYEHEMIIQHNCIENGYNQLP